MAGEIRNVDGLCTVLILILHHLLTFSCQIFLSLLSTLTVRKEIRSSLSVFDALSSNMRNNFGF